MVGRIFLCSCLSLAATLGAAPLTPTRATYFGAADCDELIADLVAVDGEVYVLGSTFCEDIPGTSGGAFPQMAAAGRWEVFVARLSADLRELRNATYFGGTADDVAAALAVTDDAVFVTGVTSSSDLPGSSSAAQPANGGAFDVFVARFDRRLEQLVRATYLGGAAVDSARGIAVFRDDVYLTGYTTSLDLPGALRGVQPQHAGGATDTFVASLPATLQGSVRSSYLGGAGREFGHAIAVNGHAVFVSGFTESSDFPGTAGGVQPALASPGIGDAFAARFDHTLARTMSSSYFGGGAMDRGDDIVVTDDAVFISGRTDSDDLPFTAGGAHPEPIPGRNAFVARFDPSLAAGVKATYFGPVANGGFWLWGGDDTVVLAGSGLGRQAFAAFFSPDLAILDRVLPFGGSEPELGQALSAERNTAGRLASVFVLGATLSKDLPSVENAFQSERRGPEDGFVVRFELDLDH